MFKRLSGYSDPNDPYNNNAYPNSWTPPLNQTWDFGVNRINGLVVTGRCRSLVNTPRIKLFFQSKSRRVVRHRTFYHAGSVPKVPWGV